MADWNHTFRCAVVGYLSRNLVAMSSIVNVHTGRGLGYCLYAYVFLRARELLVLTSGFG